MNQAQETNQQQTEPIEEKEQKTRLKKVLNEEFSMQEIQDGELEQLELLQEVYKNCTLSIQSIEIVRPMVKDKPMRNMLFSQYNSYKALAKEIEMQAATNGYDLHAANIINKAMMYGGLLLNTIIDRSASKLAEIMIQGINLGIISMVKVTNNIDEQTNIDVSLSNKLMDMLENNINALKPFL